MSTTKSASTNNDQTKDRDRALEQAIRDALILAAGKKAANQALRHVRSRAHRHGQRRLGHVAGHLAGYGSLLAYIWYRGRARKHAAA